MILTCLNFISNCSGCGISFQIFKTLDFANMCFIKLSMCDSPKSYGIKMEEKGPGCSYITIITFSFWSQKLSLPHSFRIEITSNLACSCENSNPLGQTQFVKMWYEEASEISATFSDLSPAELSKHSFKHVRRISDSLWRTCLCFIYLWEHFTSGRCWFQWSQCGFSSVSLWPPGMLYYAALNEKLFTTKLGNSFKCASRQTFPLENNFQILFVHMQLQAFDIVGDQFGKGE